MEKSLKVGSFLTSKALTNLQIFKYLHCMEENMLSNIGLLRNTN